MSPNMSNHVVSTMSEASHGAGHSATLNHGGVGVGGVGDGLGTLVFTSSGVMPGGGVGLTSRDLRDDAALTGDIRDDATLELQPRRDADKSNINYSRGDD